MKVKQITETKEVFTEVCPKCKKKEVTGVSEQQVNSRMSMHQRSKFCKLNR